MVKEIQKGNILMARYLGGGPEGLFWLPQFKDNPNEMYTAEELKFHQDMNWLYEVFTRICGRLRRSPKITIQCCYCEVSAAGGTIVFSHKSTQSTKDAMWVTFKLYLEWLDSHGVLE